MRWLAVSVVVMPVLLRGDGAATTSEGVYKAWDYQQQVLRPVHRDALVTAYA